MFYKHVYCYTNLELYDANTCFDVDIWSVNNVSTDYMEFKGTRFIDNKDIYSHVHIHQSIVTNQSMNIWFYSLIMLRSTDHVNRNKLWYNKTFYWYLTCYYFINEISILSLISHGNQRSPQIGSAQFIHRYRHIVFFKKCFFSVLKKIQQAIVFLLLL